MVLTQNTAGAFRAPSLQHNRQHTANNAVWSASRVKVVGPAKVQAVSAAQTQRVYLLQEAPTGYIRSVRAARTAGTYRTELQEAESKEDVGSLHAQQMGGLLAELKRSEATEAGFIGKHIQKLNAQRSEFMTSEKYQRLPSLADQAEGKAKPLWEVEATDNTARDEDTKAGTTQGKQEGAVGSVTARKAEPAAAPAKATETTPVTTTPAAAATAQAQAVSSIGLK